jgi:tripartite ATP-independent transporter DctP family solute receptor
VSPRSDPHDPLQSLRFNPPTHLYRHYDTEADGIASSGQKIRTKKEEAMKRNRVIVLVAFCFFFASLVMAGRAEARTLILGHGAAPGNPRTLACDVFTKLVFDGTGGRISIQAQGSEQLGSDVEMLQAVQIGALDITVNSQGPLATIVPEAAIFGLPFLFSMPQEAWRILDGPIGDRLAALTEKQGLKVLAWWDNGVRHITNNARPIKEPVDLHGIKLRTPKDPMTIDIFNTLGANPTPIAFGELYLALRQGTVDGQENPLVNIWSSKLYEVQKYLSLSGHKYEMTPFIVSPKTWQSLSVQDQKAIGDAVQLAKTYQRLELVRQESMLLDKLVAAGIRVNTTNQYAFRQATKPVYKSWRKKMGAIVDELLNAAQEARK